MDFATSGCLRSYYVLSFRTIVLKHMLSDDHFLSLFFVVSYLKTTETCKLCIFGGCCLYKIKLTYILPAYLTRLTMFLTVH